MQLHICQKKIDSFSLLQSGWGSADSIAPTAITISHARQFVDLLPTGAALPHVSVAEDGEFNFLWRSDSVYIDVGIYGDGQIHYYVSSKVAGIEKDNSEPLSVYFLPKEIIAAIAAI